MHYFPNASNFGQSVVALADWTSCGQSVRRGADILNQFHVLLCLTWKNKNKGYYLIAENSSSVNAIWVEVHGK